MSTLDFLRDHLELEQVKIGKGDGGRRVLSHLSVLV